MAEAVPETDNSPNKALPSLSSITECPVCIETLRKPRSLPCHHTFCLECLETYIGKVTQPVVADDPHAPPPSFPCPVCRTLVLPPTTSVDSKQWARQLPTNTFVLAILEKQSKENNDTCKCSPCQRQDKDVDGTLFCKQCFFFMCRHCKSSLHDIIHTDHHVISSTGGQHKTKHTISEEVLCERHGEKMEYVCLDHAVIECYKCVIADHRQCLKVVPLMEYATEIREKDQVTETLSDLAHGSQDMTSLSEAFRVHSEMIKDNESAVKQELEDMLKLFLDIKQKTETNLSKKTKANLVKHQDKVDEFESLGKSMTDTNAAIKAVMSEGNEVHLVSQILRAQAEIRTCKQLSHHILACWFTERLSLNITPSLKSLQCMVDSPTEYIASSREHQPLPTLNLCQSLYGRTAKLMSTFQIHATGSRITGSIFLDSGHLFLVDHKSKCLLLYNDKGARVDSMTLNAAPLCCGLLQEKVAVTVVEPKLNIFLLQIKDETITRLRQIDLQVIPYGIAVTDGNIIVTCPDEEPCRIIRVTKDGLTEQLLTVDGRPTRMTSRGKNVFISDMNSKIGQNGIRCISTDTCVCQTIKSDTVTDPRGLDFDREGNLYVCGRGSGNVVQISKDMQQCRDLLTSVGEVESIAFNGNSFFLSIYKSSDGFIYELV